jgi:hypothetical protein
MKRFLLVAAVAIAVLESGAVRAYAIDPAEVERLAGKFFMTLTSGTPGQDDFRFIYTDQAGHIHISRIEKGALKQDWETTTLGSRASAIFVADLYADGRKKLVVSTTAGRILIYDLESYELEWENLQLRYTRIDYMVPVNLDDDRQLEVVILADGRFFIFDGYNRNIQFSSTVTVVANFMVIGNVDDDPQPEIVLNTGKIIDGRFYNIQFQTDKAFGDRIYLMDITGDGFDDVVGEFSDRSLRVFDVWRTREVW